MKTPVADLVARSLDTSVQENAASSVDNRTVSLFALCAVHARSTMQAMKHVTGCHGWSPFAVDQYGYWLGRCQRMESYPLPLLASLPL